MASTFLKNNFKSMNMSEEEKKNFINLENL